MNNLFNLQQLQYLTLECQGLMQTSPFGEGKNAVLKIVEDLGYVQIDTLSVIERSHHHTLWTRIPDYQAEYLEQLMLERQLFEYWFHAASYLPIKDFRFALPQMSHFKRGESRYYQADPKVMQYVLDCIRIDGPKKAKDFEHDSKKQGSWWQWKPAKLALERLFMQGDLMISGRDGMQKLYDIQERVLPSEIDVTEPTPLEFAEYLVTTYLRAYGFTTVKQIMHLKTGEALRKSVDEILRTMIHEKTIQQVNLVGKPAIFVQSDLMDKEVKVPIANIQLLSPFDNAIIHRERIKQLFNFDFRLECYLPKEKRQYGYFCLPILFAGKFIGRVDCKAHRKEKRLELIHLHVENMEIELELWLKPFMDTVYRFAHFNGCQSVTLTQVSPAKLESVFKQVL